MTVCECVFNKVFMFVCASVCVCVLAGWLVRCRFILYFFAFHINRTTYVCIRYSMFICTRAHEYSLIRHKNNNKKRIVTGFMSTELIALHKLRCYDRCLFACLHVFITWWLSMVLLCTIVGFVVVGVFASLILILFTVMVCVREYVCVWVAVCVCLRLHPLWFFKSTNTHTHTGRLLTCFLLMFSK